MYIRLKRRGESNGIMNGFLVNGPLGMGDPLFQKAGSGCGGGISFLAMRFSERAERDCDSASFIVRFHFDCHSVIGFLVFIFIAVEFFDVYI